MHECAHLLIQQPASVLYQVAEGWCSVVLVIKLFLLQLNMAETMDEGTV